MNTIGASTRREQITKWKDAVAKYTDLLLAFTYDEITDEDLARFRGECADRINDLANYLATGEWGLFSNSYLVPPPSNPLSRIEKVTVTAEEPPKTEPVNADGQTKAEEDAELAERAAAEEAAAQAEAAADVPTPREERTGCKWSVEGRCRCGIDDNVESIIECDGHENDDYGKPCPDFEPKADGAANEKPAKKSKKKGGKK